MTITGTGFVAGAVVRVNGNLLPTQPFTGSTSNTNALPEVTFGTATVVNATTITVPVTTQTLNGGTATNNTPTRWDVSVTNPDGTNYTAAGAIGWLEAGNSAYTTPTVTMVTDGLTPGKSIVTLAGNAAFGLAAGDTVTLSYGPFSFTGSMINGTQAQFYLPQYLSTTLTQAATAGQTNIVVGNLAGISTQALTFVDATGETVTAATETPVTSSVGLGAALKYSHAAGTVVEFPIQSVTNWTLGVNNGSTTLNIAGLNVGATPAESITYHRTDGTTPTGSSASETWPINGTPMNLAPGTYTMLVTFPGANFATGAASIAFATATGANPDGITGTITPTNKDTAYVTITMPGSVSTPTYTNLNDPLTALAPQGSTTLDVNTTTTTLTAGETIELNYGMTNQEQVKIASVSGSGANTVVTLTTPTTFVHQLGDTVSSVVYSSASTGTTYNAIVNTGNGQLITEAGFATTEASKVGAITGFSFTGGPAGAPGLIVGAGASKAAVNIFGSFTGSQTGTDYVVTSTTPGVTFGAVTLVSPTQIRR